MPSLNHSNRKSPPRSFSIRSLQDLKKLQRLMARTVMHPLTGTGRMRPKTFGGKVTRKVADGFIRPNARLSSFERLEIYNRQYWFRLRECFHEDFPGLRAVLGEKHFGLLSRAYLEQNPSRSFTLRNLGSRLPAWIKNHSRLPGPKSVLARDMARLEWAHIEAFDLEARPPFSLDRLQGKTPGRIRLFLQPHLQLLQLTHPADNLLIQSKSGSAGESIASNVVREPGKRKKPRSAAVSSGTEKIYLAVHRLENSVYYKRLGKEAFQFLRALHRGGTLAQAAQAAFRGSRCPSPSRPNLIQQSVAQAAALNWFCER